MPFLLAFMAVALLLIGAGAYSVDAKLWGRANWPAPVTLGLLAFGVLAAILTWVVLNGTNPIHLSAPAGS
jgi:hypothetical protein